MPKLMHNFLQGKMNKDLDERIVPNGQYRDAQNIQVSTSEGSDVGAVENILGNFKQITNNGVAWADKFGLVNPICIGGTRDTQNEKIYWFIASDNYDVIAEFNESTGDVEPVVVDRFNVLKFSDKYLITGVNVLEGMLLFTDNNSEPKKVNIERFKQGTPNFSTHSNVYGRAFVESDITVIKKKPEIAPSLTMRSTRKTGSGVGCGINTLETTFNFTVPSGPYWRVMEEGESVTLNFPSAPDWAVGDTISLRASRLNDKNFTDEFQVRIEVTAVNNGQVTGDILTISTSIVDYYYVWTAALEEDDPMFELKFPRFAYRWKYIDGEYSAYSPFSEVAFIGDTFGYKSARAHNVGMSNNLRFLEVGGFETPPADVEKVEILYKETNSPNIFKVDDIAAATTSYEITSEIIGYGVEGRQLLRPWDNVPVKALAQEIIGNRVVYGNYLQNLDMEGIAPVLTASKSAVAHTSVNDPLPSIKSMRTYQLGVVYGDAYGRETPVFTSEDSSIILSKRSADKVATLKATISSNAPAFAEYFKIFVKDISNEYYNVALDRFYEAEDGNVWISFPSAEINKVREDGYLILKKEHDNDTPVLEDAKFKILDISKSAPDDVVNKRVKVAAHKCVFAAQSSLGQKEFEFTGPHIAMDPMPSGKISNISFQQAWNEKLYVRFSATDATDYYEVKEGGFTGEDEETYSLTLVSGLKADDAQWMTATGPNADITVSLYRYKSFPKPEYQGKFFIKINREPAFDTYVINSLVQNSTNYVQYSQSSIFDLAIQDDPDDQLLLPGGMGIVGYADYNQTPDVPVLNSNQFTLVLANSSMITDPENTGNVWFDLVKANAFIKFDSDTTNHYYKIDSVVHSLYERGSDLTTPTIPNDGDGVQKTVTLTEPFQSDTSLWTNFDFKLYYKKTDWADILDDGVILSSQKPAIFETEPAESVDIDIYYEATDGIPIAQHGNTITLDYFNCYSFGNGVESNRIRDDFNAPTIDKGTKASSTLEEPYSQERKGASLIYSGIFNSTSGVNELNQFVMAEKITKDLNPIYGTIQKLSSRGGGVRGDLLALCEDKCFKILADKDALYNADGNTNITSTNNVLGQAIPFAGDYGISKNPESFASHGFRSYFTDKARGAILRLSMDGLTEIASKGMSRYLQKEMQNETKMVGSYDEDTSTYNVAIGDNSYSFSEGVDGWVTRLSYVPEFAVSLNNKYFTVKAGELWEHNSPLRSNFYGTQYESSVTPIFNDAPNSIKNFKTLSYEGDAGWVADVVTDQQDGEVKTWKKKEGFYFNYINGLQTTWDNASQSGSLDTSEFSVQGLGVLSLNAVALGSDIDIQIPGKINVSLQVGDDVYYKDISANEIIKIGNCSNIGANVITVSNPTNVAPPVAGDFIFFAKDSEKNTSGIIGYYGEVKLSTTSSDKKELFAVNSEMFISSE